jgi:hypothetical protein
MLIVNIHNRAATHYLTPSYFAKVHSRGEDRIMQGRPGQGGEPWGKLDRRGPSLNGTGKPRAIPQRPPGMNRVERPPVTPRIERPPTTPHVDRPQRLPAPPGRNRMSILVLGGVVLALALIAAIGGYIGYNLFRGAAASAGAATTAQEFLNDLSNQDYTNAYRDLGATITLQVSSQQFTQQAQNDDRCYGPIKNYSEVPNSATIQNDSQSYTYDIVRGKSTRSYRLRLTLQQDPESGNAWKITDYGGDLGPGGSAPTCK